MPLPAYEAIDPAVLHFVGRLKPWDGAYHPWTQAEFQPYVDMALALETAGVKWRRQSTLRRLAYRLKPYLQQDDYADPNYRRAISDLIIRKCRETQP